jgi:hypothetical protein
MYIRIIRLAGQEPISQDMDGGTRDRGTRFRACQDTRLETLRDYVWKMQSARAKGSYTVPKDSKNFVTDN